MPPPRVASWLFGAKSSRADWEHAPLILCENRELRQTLLHETGANSTSLGLFEAKYLIRLMQANAKMFDKFGA